jgi:putative membrane protein
VATAVFVAVLGIVLLILAGWIVSIVLTVARYYGFSLRQSEDRLRRRYGLFTQVESVVPLRRIQVLRLEAPLLRRLARRFTVYAETAGSAVDKETGGSTPVCPLVRQGDVARLCRLAFRDLEFNQVDWRPVSRLTVRRGFIRYAAALLVLVGLGMLVDHLVTPSAGAPLVGWKALFAIPVVLALAAVWAWARYRALGYAETVDYLLARAGVLTRKIWVVPHGKVQSVSVNQTPFQRRLRLADVAIDTAGSQFLSGAEVVDLPYETAVALQDDLSQAANAQGLWLPDGV